MKVKNSFFLIYFLKKIKVLEKHMDTRLGNIYVSRCIYTLCQGESHTDI